jgi:type II secretory pathway pseudopilin PulG
VSRSAELRSRREAGFTLVEVVVAIAIVMVVVTALLPQLVGGIRATGTARTVSQAKGVIQGQLDRMRNLPYHVSPDAGPYRDVLDYYFNNRSTAAPSPTCTVSGKYVALPEDRTGFVDVGGARCAYEPPTGAFYRSVSVLPPAPGNGGFTVVVSTQFLSGDTPPVAVTPVTHYNSQLTGKASPASSQIGVWITVLYSNRGTLRPVTSYTQLYDQPASATRTKAEVGAATLEIGSVTEANGAVSLMAGVLNLNGSLNNASTVNGNLSGASAGLATGEQASGASASVAAPPATATLIKTASSGSLVGSACPLACWGSTRLDLTSVSADSGLPTAGGPSSPMQALLTDLGNGGFSFGNSDNLSDYRDGLNLQLPLARIDSSAVAGASGTTSSCTPGTGTPAFVGASGYLRSTPSGPAAVEACVIGRASSISLFPTTFAPRGVVLVELRKATARCLVSGTAHTATAAADYEAVVKYYDGSTYQTAATVSPSNSTDPLDGVDLGTPVGVGHTLGDYIASWSSLTATEINRTQITGLAEVQLPGVVTIVSQPVRKSSTVTTGDPTSAVSLTLGALKCSALDQR